MGRLKG